MDVMDQLKEQVEQNTVLLYMKGSPNQPQCGFSARVVQAMMACGQRFAYVDVLSNPEIRANLPTFANWPTFPQLWVNGELDRWLRHHHGDAREGRTGAAAARGRRGCLIRA
jgi:monothiol glutaredoxin